MFPLDDFKVDRKDAVLGLDGIERLRDAITNGIGRVDRLPLDRDPDLAIIDEIEGKDFQQSRNGIVRIECRVLAVWVGNHELHPSRLQRRRSAAPAVDAAWEEIEALYQEWLQARYDVFDMPAGLVRQRLRMARHVFDHAVQVIATRVGKTKQEIRVLADVRAFGSTEAPVYEALAAAHDHVFAEAERSGEQNGARLGTKMAAATNFSDVDFVASDTMTREIIKNDEKIASECARLHVRLCSLMEMLRDHRYNSLVSDGLEPNVAHNESTNFMVALRFKYHGETLSQTGENLSRSMQLALGQIVQSAPVDLTNKCGTP